MTTRYDIMHKKVDLITNKTVWVKVGGGFEHKNGTGGITLRFDSIPLNWDGTAAIFPVDENGKQIRFQREPNE